MVINGKPYAIGKWWFNGILMGFNGLYKGYIWANYNDLTVLPHWKSWLGFGESSPNGLNSGL